MIKVRLNLRNVVKIVAILAVSTMFMGCEKPEDGKGENSSLIGEWDYTKHPVTTFTFTVDNKWSAFDHERNSERRKGTYNYDEKAGIIYLTYVPETDDPVFGVKWKLIGNISSTLEVETYNENGKAEKETLILTRKK